MIDWAGSTLVRITGIALSEPTVWILEGTEVATGQTVAMTVSGTPQGRLAARVSSLAVSFAGDTNSVVLEVGFPEPAPPSPWPIVGAILALLIVLRGLVAVRPPAPSVGRSGGVPPTEGRGRRAPGARRSGACPLRSFADD